MRRLPKLKLKTNPPSLNWWGGQKSKILIGILLFLITTFFPQSVKAYFIGGINIGDHYSEFSEAAATGASWIYVMMTPSEAYRLNQWLTSYPSVNLIIRGHVPDFRGNSLTSSYAQRWAEVFSNISRPIYFVPVNEPNNPGESGGGIEASVVSSYIGYLKSALEAKNLLQTKKVILLSPAIDVYTLSDRGPAYIQELGGWNFFKQFDGIALNLYGQFDGGVLDQNAPPIKKGQGYREFLKSHFGASEQEAQQTKIYAVETGVIKIQDAKVKYKENSLEIINYLNIVKPIWNADPNFIMFSIFSYDPAGDHRPWIYNQKEVLQAMNFSPINVSVTPYSTSPEEFSGEAEILNKAVKKLTPMSILEKYQREECVGGIKILGKCFFIKSSKSYLSQGAERFQPIYVSEKKVITEESCSLFKCILDSIEKVFETVTTKHLAEKQTGSFNIYRPNSLEFSQVEKLAYSEKSIAQNPDNNTVLGVTDKQKGKSPEEVVKEAFNFTTCMLLPYSLQDRCQRKKVLPTQPPQIFLSPTPTVAFPLPTVGLTITPSVITPTPVLKPTCTEGTGYCSVAYLSNYFPDETSARIASKICQRESGSNPQVMNKGCLTGSSLDYSIGLFQINLLAHCASDAFSYSWEPVSCQVIDWKKVETCEKSLLDPDTNILWAVRISNNGTDWRPWYTDIGCSPF